MNIKALLIDLWSVFRYHIGVQSSLPDTGLIAARTRELTKALDEAESRANTVRSNLVMLTKQTQDDMKDFDKRCYDGNADFDNMFA
jgi:hypothetical protein